MKRTNTRLGGLGILALVLVGPGPVQAGDRGPEFPSLPSATALSFYQKLTGIMPGARKDLRWTLRFVNGQPRLSVQTRNCPGSSQEQGAAVPSCKEPFGKPVVSYEGKLIQRPYGVELRLSREAPAEDYPSGMNLTCLRTVVGVLPPGASLGMGDACKGDGPPPRWQPGATKDVGLWLCRLHDEQGGPWNGYGTVGPLAFAQGPGVEWIFVNNDCAGQEGAYRALPGP